MITNRISKKVLSLVISLVTVTSVFSFLTSNSYATSDWETHWAKDTIQQFIDKGYIGGYSDGTFKPNNSITRAEFVTIFNKAFELTTKSGKVFNDINTHWAKDEIDIAVSNGVCKGKTVTEFKPNDSITREEASVMIANYKKLSDENYNRINSYIDRSQVSSWAKNSVEGVMEKGYMGGYSDATFRPKGKITRAEAVVTINRVVSNTPLPVVPQHPVVGKYPLPCIEDGHYDSSGVSVTVYTGHGAIRYSHNIDGDIMILSHWGIMEDAYAMDVFKQMIIFASPGNAEQIISASLETLNGGTFIVGNATIRQNGGAGPWITIDR